MIRATAMLAVALAAAGCVKSFPVDSRATYETLTDARALDGRAAGPIAIQWVPTSFPDRMDIHGPRSTEGAASRARIPTGVVIAQRTTELLDAAVGVDPVEGRELVIEVLEAETAYWYSVGITRRINRAGCTLDARFRCGDRAWDGTFMAGAVDPELGEPRGAQLLDDVWNDIALQVTASVVQHLEPAPAATRARASAPAAVGDESTPLTSTEGWAVLRRLLIRKGVFTEAEWQAEVERLRGKAPQR